MQSQYSVANSLLHQLSNQEPVVSIPRPVSAICTCYYKDNIYFHVTWNVISMTTKLDALERIGKKESLEIYSYSKYGNDNYKK